MKVDHKRSFVHRLNSMGIHRFLNIQLIPSCFHMMGNPHASCAQHDRRTGSDASSTTIKLIKLDGQVKMYRHPIPVSELMTEFPKHLVCRSDAFYIGHKIPALSEHDLLEPGHNYFLLPNHFFQSVLSFVMVASFIASWKANDRPQQQHHRHAPPGKPAACWPFNILTTPSGSLRIHVSDEFISQLTEEGKTREEGLEKEEKAPCTRLCSTPQLEKDYEQLVAGSRSRRWEPKLETIRESRKERKRRISSSSTRTKSPSSSSTSSSPSSSKPSSKSKIIKIRSRK